MKTVHLQQFRDDAARTATNASQRAYLHDSLDGYAQARASTQATFSDWQRGRDILSGVKWHAIEHLDELLEQFAANLEARGTKVCWAPDAGAARDYIVRVCKQHNAQAIVKSKTMTSEEIELNPALEALGYDVVETDLGEFIVQIRNEPPYHFVFPAMHLKRGVISDDFARILHAKETDDPEELTMIARRALRERYVRADVGITGANFGVAETGMISITENEGNARLTMSLPRVHIALIGIEKVIPRLHDLALFLPMLATCGTGQHLTCYNSLIGGPRQSGEADGPDEFHVVLLDNGRSNLLHDPHLRDALRCIRCGACLNVCPVFQNAGGHAYGTPYQGPIGSVITPHLREIEQWSHLSFASSLCGACTATCPVQIDLHHHLLRTRERAVRTSGGRFIERCMVRLYATVMTHPRMYRMLSRVGRWMHVLSKPMHGSFLDPLRAWRRTRTFPEPSPKTFQHLWKERSRT